MEGSRVHSYHKKNPKRFASKASKAPKGPRLRCLLAFGKTEDDRWGGQSEQPVISHVNPLCVSLSGENNMWWYDILYFYLMMCCTAVLKPIIVVTSHVMFACAWLDRSRKWGLSSLPSAEEPAVRAGPQKCWGSKRGGKMSLLLSRLFFFVGSTDHFDSESLFWLVKPRGFILTPTFFGRGLHPFGESIMN